MFILFRRVPTGQCALNARSARGVIEELNFTAGDNHTEQLAHPCFHIPIDHSSLKCIHACQHPSDAWTLQSDNRTFRKTFLVSTWTIFLFSKMDF